MDAYRVYFLNKGVQVRREKFGLLFYDYRGPRLYFLPTKDLVEDQFFEGRQTMADLIKTLHKRHGQWPEKWIAERLDRIFNQLEAKGLIHGQSIC